jgi:transcriptional regulator NrdR family protein
MRCRSCKSSNTRVTVTEHKVNETWRYCRCLDCKSRYKTIEKYSKPKSKISLRSQETQFKQGETNPSSVLTEANVIALRKLVMEGKTYVEIAEKFGIHRDTVYRIANRKLWSHV